MNFKKRIIEELKLSEIQANTLLKDYVSTCEKLAKEYHKEQLTLTDVGQHRELLIDCVRTCLKDKDSITVEQQVGNYIFLKGN